MASDWWSRGRELDPRPGRGCVRRLWASCSYPITSKLALLARSIESLKWVPNTCRSGVCRPLGWDTIDFQCFERRYRPIGRYSDAIISYAVSGRLTLRTSRVFPAISRTAKTCIGWKMKIHTRNRIVTCHTVKTQRPDTDKISNEDPGYLDRKKTSLFKRRSFKTNNNIHSIYISVFFYLSKDTYIAKQARRQAGGALDAYAPPQISKM